jgi:phenazine biosynthesis protein phzE
MPQSDEDCVLAVIPFRQVIEKGYACRDDKLSIEVLVGKTRPVVDHQEFAQAGDEPFQLSEIRFEPDDAEYESLVNSVIHREIGGGSGSNFVIHRSLRAKANISRANWLDKGARQTFSYLLRRDPNAYWRFWIRLPELTFVGSSPELHLGYESGRLTMTPMSGTLRVTPLTELSTVREFIDNRKENEELFMVLDEELKMICQMNPSSVAIQGPHLDIFGNVAHTYFKIEADTKLSVYDALLRSLFAPTVTGSPVREACSVIARNEHVPRGYYGGVLCQFKRQGSAIRLDSAIAIRTAYIKPTGEVRLPVGATIVRHSNARAEVAETTSKAAGLLAALQGAPPSTTSLAVGRLLSDGRIQRKLQSRRSRMSDFWLSGYVPIGRKFQNTNALIVDFDDDWTSMLGYLISGFGIQCKILKWQDLQTEGGFDDWLIHNGRMDLLVLGPGPGNPMDESDPRIRLANSLAGKIGVYAIPTLAVCLSHQCLSRRFGMRLARLTDPTQGTVRKVPIGRSVYSLAFYNSYSAYYDSTMPLPENTKVWRDVRTGEVFGFTAPGLVSVQFHLESSISRDGIAVADALLSKLLHRAARTDL